LGVIAYEVGRDWGLIVDAISKIGVLAETPAVASSSEDA
jgi:hypothetical protein